MRGFPRASPSRTTSQWLLSVRRTSSSVHRFGGSPSPSLSLSVCVARKREERGAVARSEPAFLKRKRIWLFGSPLGSNPGGGEGGEERGGGKLRRGNEMHSVHARMHAHINIR